MADSKTGLPTIDEDRIREVFSELGDMEVELDPDPLEFGPKQLNHKVAKVRGMLTRCERIFLQISHDLQLYKRTHRGEQLDFDLQMQDLYANDPEVRAGRNVKDREALAVMKLREQRETVMGMEVAIQDLEMVLSVIKAKRADLRDLQGRLRDQMKLCQEELGLGSKWGSKLPPGKSAPDLDAAPRTDPKALAQLQELTVGDDSEVHVQTDDPAWLAEDGEDQSIDDLLGQLKEDAAALRGGEDAEDEDAEDEDEDAEDEDEDAEDEDDLESAVESAWAGKSFDEFPQLGYCVECGEPAHETPSGSMCKNGHGGADWTAEPPAPEETSEEDTPPEPVVNTEEDSDAEEVPEPEPSGDSLIDDEPPAKQKHDDLDVDDLFDRPAEDAPSIPEVKSDADVDNLFDALDAAPVQTKTVKKPSGGTVASENLDDLIDIFGD